MMQSTVFHSLRRALRSPFPAPVFLAIFLLITLPGHAQKTTAALPAVITTNGMMDAATATGHPRVITLREASSLPLVHSSFATIQPGAPPASNHSVQSLNAFSTTTAEGVYQYGSQTLEHSFVNRITPPPSFSSPSGEYTGQLRLMLGGGSPQTQIYYTLNGQEPTTSSTLYTKPLTLTSNATVKAIAFTSGQPPSTVAQAEYQIVQPRLTLDFASNGVDSVEIFLNLNAPGAASVAGEWVVTDGNLTLCRVLLTTESMMHCTARLNRGNHELAASYTGAVNGWSLATSTTLRIE